MSELKLRPPEEKKHRTHPMQSSHRVGHPVGKPKPTRKIGAWGTHFKQTQE
jgi:hypothetical protein